MEVTDVQSEPALDQRTLEQQHFVLSNRKLFLYTPSTFNPNVGFFPALTSSWVLAGCPTIWFNSDAVCVEPVSDPTA